ncbi:MAG: nuclear transport factor 2 family protein [Sphingobacteriia bacterium]|nr:nuclear transport factor 2 family protein [Sphingobacteriia bacterium]
MKDTVDKLFQALNNHDIVLITKLFADSARLESPNWEGSKIGPIGAKEVYLRYFNSTPDLKFTITQLTIGPNTAVVEYKTEGTLQYAEQGTPDYMVGKKYIIKNITRLNLQSGKILESNSYFDQVSFLKQVGFFDKHS